MSFRDELQALKQPSVSHDHLDEAAREVQQMILDVIREHASRCPAGQRLSCNFYLQVPFTRSSNWSYKRETFFTLEKHQYTVSLSPRAVPFLNRLRELLRPYGVTVGDYVLRDARGLHLNDDATIRGVSHRFSDTVLIDFLLVQLGPMPMRKIPIDLFLPFQYSYKKDDHGFDREVTIEQIGQKIRLECGYNLLIPINYQE